MCTVTSRTNRSQGSKQGVCNVSVRSNRLANKILKRGISVAGTCRPIDVPRGPKKREKSTLSFRGPFGKCKEGLTTTKDAPAFRHFTGERHVSSKSSVAARDRSGEI